MATTIATISADAPGGGTDANVAAADRTGRVLCQVANVGKLKNYDHVWSGIQRGTHGTADSTAAAKASMPKTG